MTRRLEARGIVQDSLVNLLRMTGSALLGLFVSAIVARTLGPENKGIYELTILIPIVLQNVINISIVSATWYHVARRDFELQTIVQGNIAFSLWLSISGIVVGLALYTFAGDTLLPGLSWIHVCAALLMLPVLHLRLNLHAVFLGLQDFRTYGLSEISFHLFMLILVMICAITLPGNSLVLVGCVLAANLLTVLVLLVFLRKRLGGLQILSKYHLDADYARSTFYHGVRSQIMNMANYLLVRLDLFLLNIIGGGIVSVGIYSITVILVERVWTLTGFTSYVIAPRIAAWKDDDMRRNEITVFVTRYTLWLSVLIAIVIMIVGEWAIVLIYTAEFVNAANALLWLLPGVVMYSLARVISADINGRGKPQINSMHALISLIINFLANLILIPRYDFIGAALASSIAYSYFGIALVAVFCRMNRVAWWHFILPTQYDVQLWSGMLRLIITRVRHVLTRK